MDKSDNKTIRDWWSILTPEEQEDIKEQEAGWAKGLLEIVEGYSLGSFNLVQVRLSRLYKLHSDPLDRPAGDILKMSDWGQAVLDLMEAYDAWLD